MYDIVKGITRVMYDLETALKQHKSDCRIVADKFDSPCTCGASQRDEVLKKSIKALDDVLWDIMNNEY